MAKIYISSTFSDLEDCRTEVYRTLRKMRHDVMAMEDMVATGQRRPLDDCLRDVADCDIYIGIFAWRYGYRPESDNPDNLSITELEYRHARALGKPCFIFLQNPDAPWVPAQMEFGSIADMQRFRQELGREHTVMFFETKERLAHHVAVSLRAGLTEEWTCPLDLALFRVHEDDRSPAATPGTERRLVSLQSIRLFASNSRRKTIEFSSYTGWGTFERFSLLVRRIPRAELEQAMRAHRIDVDAMRKTPLGDAVRQLTAFYTTALGLGDELGYADLESKDGQGTCAKLLGHVEPRVLNIPYGASSEELIAAIIEVAAPLSEADSESYNQKYRYRTQQAVQVVTVPRPPFWVPDSARTQCGYDGDDAQLLNETQRFVCDETASLFYVADLEKGWKLGSRWRWP